MHKYRNIYIGKVIQQKVDESRMSYAEFARQIHVARTSLYHIFESKSMDIERLLLISEVLEYDFIHEVYLPDYNRNDGGTTHGELPQIVLPISNGRIHLANLPQPLLQILKDAME